MEEDRLEYVAFDTLIREATATVEQELAIEDQGWLKLGGVTYQGITAAERILAVQNSRLYFIKDPLARQAIRLWTDYTFGSGMTYSIPEENDAAKKALDDFWQGRQNRTILGAQGQRKSSDKLLVDGEIFFALFLGPNGEATIRRIDPLEITEIISDPEDVESVLYYKREWTTPQSKTQKAFLRSHTNPQGLPAIDSKGASIATKEGPLVFHVTINTIGQRGNPLLLPAIDWIKQYRRFLASRVAIMLALSKFAWKTKVKGGASAVASQKAVLDDKAPAAGSTWYENEGSEMTPIKTDSGAKNAYDDARLIKLQVSAAVGIPEQYWGDISCYSQDTEVLTERGWMPHFDWQAGMKVASYNPDTETIEYIVPDELRSFPYVGSMVHFKNAQTDIMVTPNHRMWTAPKVGWALRPPRLHPERGGRRSVAEGGVAVVDREWGFLEADHLIDNPRAHGWQFRNTSSINGCDPEPPIADVDIKDWATFLGFWISEGYALSPTHRDGTERERIYYRVAISQREGETLEDMRMNLHWLGLKFHEQINQAGVISLTVVNKMLWQYLREHCGKNSHAKRIPRSLLGASQETRQNLLASLLKGDGGPANGQGSGGMRYSTVSKQLADDVMELAFSLGYATSVTLEGNNVRSIWRVAIREKTLGTHIRPRHVSTDFYSGQVYCFALPVNHIYVTRRNGKVAIQGNTGNLATAKTVELPMLKQFQSNQQLWKDAYGAIDDAVLEHAGVAEDKRYVDRDFPSIAPDDAAELAISVQAIVQTFPDMASLPEVQSVALQSLGIDDVDKVLEKINQEEAVEGVAPGAKLKLLRAVREVKKELTNGHGK